MRPAVLAPKALLRASKQTSKQTGCLRHKSSLPQIQLHVHSIHRSYESAKRRALKSFEFMFHLFWAASWMSLVSPIETAGL